MFTTEQQIVGFMYKMNEPRGGGQDFKACIVHTRILSSQPEQRPRRRRRRRRSIEKCTTKYLQQNNNKNKVILNVNYHISYTLGILIIYIYYNL